MKFKWIRVFWASSNAELYWSSYGDVRMTDPSGSVHWMDLWCKNAYFGNGGNYPMSGGAYQNSNSLIISNNVADSTVDNTAFADSVKNLFVYGAANTYPSGYEGTLIRTGLEDEDEDGANFAYELTQGTEDTYFDSDGDGISDYRESRWDPYYDETYCDLSVSPKVCSYPNPVHKDYYLEIDWLKNGSNEYKPNSTQIGMLTSYLADIGITLHTDMGEFGGGNALPEYSANVNWAYTSGVPDLTDFMYGGVQADTGFDNSMTAQFSPDRYDVWRYMVFGAINVPDAGSGTNVMGISSVIGDQLLIAPRNTNAGLGIVSSNRAVAGLMLHEIGHTLCLSSVRYWDQQDASCQYDEIDTSGPDSYGSVMNYKYTLPIESGLTDLAFSDGFNYSWPLVDDNDDLSAINNGMGGFIYLGELSPYSELAAGGKFKHDKKHKIDGLPEVHTKNGDKARAHMKLLREKAHLKVIQKQRELFRK